MLFPTCSVLAQALSVSAQALSVSNMAPMHAGEHARACNITAGRPLRGSASGGGGAGTVEALHRMHVCGDTIPRHAPSSILTLPSHVASTCDIDRSTKMRYAPSSYVQQQGVSDRSLS